MATPTSGSNLVDEFEEAFQSCLNVLTKDEASPTTDKDETKMEVEQTTMRFIDLGRQMEAFFLQKRFLISVLKPELVIKEDINDLRIELARKDELLKRHYDKIGIWQNMLADLQGWAKSPAQGPAPVGVATGGNVAAAPVMPTQSAPGGGVQTAGQMGVPPNMSSALQQVQLQQAQQQQIQAQLQQQQMQQMQQQQMQAQMQQQQMQQQMQVSPQQAMFMQQGTGRGAFPPQGPPGAVLQGPLAYLEKTTSNIGMTDGRR